MSWVTLVRSVLVECCCLKPCWTGERGMSCLILLRTNFSRSFDRDDSNEMGLYDEGMLGGLLGKGVDSLSCTFDGKKSFKYYKFVSRS